jgi:hypothetical protein
MVDNRRGGFGNPEQRMQQSIYDSEQAKLKEELQKLEAELEESKLGGDKAAGVLTKIVDKDYSEPGAIREPQELDEDDVDSRSVFVKNVDFSADE